LDALRNHIEEATRAIREQTALEPRICIIPASGLGSFSKHLEVIARMQYDQLPHFPKNSLNKREVILGYLAGAAVIVLSGHFPYDEGRTLQQTTFPVRVARSLGIRTLMILNQAYSINPAINAGDLMVITDHINLLGDNPLIGPNDDTLGTRFPDMSVPYSRELIQLAETISIELGIKLAKGIFVAWNGSFENAETEGRFLREIGGDVVGKNTVPEVIVAVHAGLKVLGFSVVTSDWSLDSRNPTALDTMRADAQANDARWAAMMARCVAQISG